jgi:hypothetical protein
MGSDSKPGLAGRVIEGLAATPPGPRGFLARMPDEVRAELSELRGRWQAGEIAVPCMALARRIVDECRADGLDICGPQGVATWLARRD